MDLAVAFSPWYWGLITGAFLTGSMQQQDGRKTPDEYMIIGKRIQTLRQMFGIKHGIDPMSFKMSSRMAGEPPLQAGPNKGKTVPIKEMMHSHWKAFGWDEKTGIPTRATLMELGMEKITLENQ